MSEALTSVKQDIIAFSQQVSRSIHGLQLTRLPHPQLFMLLERSTEISACLEAYLLQMKEKNGKPESDRVAQSVQELNTLLQHVRTFMAECLNGAQGVVSFERFPQQLVQIKDKARLLLADMGKLRQEPDESAAVRQHHTAWTQLVAEVQQLEKIIRELCDSATPKIAVGQQGVEKIFAMLEQRPALASLRAGVQQALKQNAQLKLAETEFFDQAFYARQLPDDNMAGQDLVGHYLASGENRAPHPFFDPQHYHNAYPTVAKLRYYALEHFVRYGEMLHYNPGPDFDAMYYLAKNEDVLDAGMPPLRHFLRHGIQEGRPPRARAGAFFTKIFLSPKGVHVGFVGDPCDSCSCGWNMLFDYCAARENSHASRMSTDDWTGNEDHLDAYVVGSEALARMSSEQLCAIAQNRRKIVYIGDNPQRDLRQLLNQDTLPLQHVCAITTSYEHFIRWQESGRRLSLKYYAFSTVDLDIPFLEALLTRLTGEEPFRLRRVPQLGFARDGKPAISVVSIIYKKSLEMKAFLEALNRQDLARPYEVVLVDDASPDNAVKEIEAWLKEKRSAGLQNKFMTVHILRNAVNSGNCTSRNRGIKAALADIVLVADGDVVQSASSLSDHLWEYRLGDCDAVVGFYKFNMDYGEVFQWLSACEVNPEIISTQMLRDRESDNRLLPNSIYRYVTRNTSFRKSALNGHYFDESLNYTSAPNSGYGEEDHELAARLYFNRKIIRFAEHSVCVHIRHGDNSYNADKALSNLRNWNRLLDKHPLLMLVDRQYYQWKTRDLLAKTRSKPNAPEVVNARARFRAPSRANIVLPQSKQLKILTFPAAFAYLYDLFKMHHVFTLAGCVDGFTSGTWDYDLRPLPYSAQLACQESVDPSAHDIAIIPFSESLLLSGKGDDSLAVWGKQLLIQLGLTRNIPRLLLCIESETSHELAERPDIQLQIEKRRAVLRALLQDDHVVLTSYQKQKIWGFTRSSVVWHGFSPQEYPEGGHQNGCLTLPRNVLREGLGGEWIRFESELKKVFPLEYMNTPEPNAGHRESRQAWAVAKYQLYASYLGAFTVFCMPLKSPAMPSVLVEGMLAGVIPVVLRNDDTSAFLQNGINGFCCETIDDLVKCVVWLSKNHDQCKVISSNARIFAMDAFNVDRCLAGWLDLIHRTL
ncbi:glycosyltransferase [Nitratidesulfovibrio liaohensis]|uniref:glycosyltransferase n=1 Tax=Nitratidesulfovibrio liaohensis TaxID=2604158 RepID=UPI0014219D0E|nr:glycosyltransferase [Nitratidesulfovibrio liaohensis]NHZ45719.1 glycosyltransferase [Nitratidesulfovibrio liaohensis]